MFTYEKVAPSKRNSAFRVPFLAVQEVESIIKDTLFHTSIEDYGSEGSFRSRGDQTPFIPGIGGVNRNLFRLGLVPAFFGFPKNVLNELM